MITEARSHEKVKHTFVNPWVELNAGLWSLFGGATIFLALRLWCKITRRHGLWYDDYILLVSWSILLANNSLIVYQFATGYVLEDSSKKWDDRMHILINISSCGTLIGQALTKTAFGVTLIRMSNRWQRWILYFCIATMNIYMVAKVVIQWGMVCGSKSGANYSLDMCLPKTTRNNVKEGGNVYNIIMDFIFASFPWLITRSLEMRRAEKVGLCITMSLGMIVAIVSAIRVGWKDDGNERDPWYIYRNGISQVWYSSEITGTIIVQCIPIFRPILREIHTSLTSKRLGSTADGRSQTFGSKLSSGKRTSTGVQAGDNNNNSNSNSKYLGANERIALREIPEEYGEDRRYWSASDRQPSSATPLQTEFKEFKPRPPTAPLPAWGPFPARSDAAASSPSSPYETELKPRPPASPLFARRPLVGSDGRLKFVPYDDAAAAAARAPPASPRSPRSPAFPRTPTSPGFPRPPPTAPAPAEPQPDMWPLSGNEGPYLTGPSSGRSLDFDYDHSRSFLDLERVETPSGLSPPPPRRSP